MSTLSSSPDNHQEESNTPQFVTILIEGAGGTLQKRKINLSNPGDRGLWVSSLVDLPPGPSNTLRVLVNDFYSVARGDAFPSAKTLGRRTRYSTATIERHLKILREQGLLSPVGKTRHGVIVYTINIHGLLHEVKPIVDKDEVKPKTPGIPAWLTRNNQIMAHWRGIYEREGTEQDLRGMPFWVAESLFMEGREEYWETKKVEKPVDKKNDLPHNDGGPPTYLPHNEGGTSLIMRDKQKREQKRRINRIPLKRQRGSAGSSTNRINKFKERNPIEEVIPTENYLGDLRRLAKGTIIGNKPTRNWNPWR